MCALVCVRVCLLQQKIVDQAPALYRYAFLDLGGNTALTRWLIARGINADAKR